MLIYILRKKMVVVNEANVNTFNYEKVNRLNFIGISVVILISVICGFILGGISAGMPTLIENGIVEVVIALVYKLKIKNEIKALIYGGIVLIVALVVTYLNENIDFSTFVSFYASVVIVAVYFKKKLILIHGIMLNIGWIVLYAIAPVKLMGNNSGVLIFISALLITDGIIAFLFFLTKWGNDLIEAAGQKEKESTLLLSKLSESINVISESTVQLNNYLGTFSSNLETTKKSSEEITHAINETSSGITDESQSIMEITSKMQNALKSMEDTQHFSEEIQEIESQMNNGVEEGTEKINHMDADMDTVKQAVNTAYVTVTKLKSSIEKINEFLGNITEIASQTNLLALNANIEAARAGESGRGFAVVAQEIGKLAEKSSDTVNSINEIIENLNSETKETVEKVKMGDSAADEGNKIVDEVSNNFRDIHESFKKNKAFIDKQNSMIQKTTELFKDIENQMGVISGISEEQAAYTQEVLSKMQEQDENISKNSELMNQINDLGKKLSGLIKK